MINISAPAFRRALLAWYDAGHRNLPWRESFDFYSVWISEVMLQQTRVETVIPYFHRFLDRFPDVASLAEAPEPEVLAAWSGLGYYSRARNLHRAAKRMADAGVPATHGEIRALPGAGPYTAAAIASIALGLPHAAVDGNVIRVISRLTDDASEVSAPGVKERFAAEAQRLLDRRHPRDFNQAVMELGATVCLPRNPQCPACPVERFCAGRAAGRERELPVKRKMQPARDVALNLVAYRRGAEVLLVRRGASEKRLAGFWELPEDAERREAGGPGAESFTHRIVNDRFHVTVREARLASGTPVEGGKWFHRGDMDSVPVTTVTRKALRALDLKNCSPGPARGV